MRRKLSILALIMVCVLTVSGIYPSHQTKAANGLKVGAWLGQAPTTSGISQYESLQQKHLDTIMFYMDWSTNFSSVRDSYVNAIVKNGSTPVITWEAWGMSNNDISRGAKDSYIRNMANDMRSYGKEIWVNLFHEANGNWYDWAVGDSKVNNNQTYIAAYRHVVDIFKNAGANNVKFIFCMNAGNSGAGASYTGHYPGANYVDIVAMDGYNWGNTQSWGSTWQSFDEIYSGVYQAACSLNKPIIISEMASTESGGNKAQWIKETYNTIRTKYPRIELVQWFNENKETDWRINSTSSALSAYVEAIGGQIAQPTPTPTQPTWPTPTPTQRPTQQPTPTSTQQTSSAVDVTVSSNVGGSGINQNYTITAKNGSIDLSKLKVRYEFTKTSNANVNFWCDNAAAQLNVSPYYESLGSSVKANISKSGNTYVVEISFANAYTLRAGTGNVVISSRITNADWSGFGTVANEKVSFSY